jgi:hypothetical protein
MHFLVLIFTRLAVLEWLLALERDLDKDCRPQNEGKLIFLVGLGFEPRAYTLSHSTSSFM